MKLRKAKLEHWMRDYYFDCAIDLGSSGVYPYDFGEVCQYAGVTFEELKTVSLGDSTTVGCLPLRQALAKRYGKCSADNVMIANGSNEVLFHVLSTILDEGDEVIALDTIYHALDEVPIAKNCHIKRWEMSQAHDFRVDLESLKQLVSTDTKLIAVNFPHNPTGVSITQAEQDELIEIAQSVGAYLVWDSAFEELTTETPLGNPFDQYDRTIYVGTLSKSYGMPGLRVGWCFAAQDVIEKSLQLRDYTTLYVSPLIELVATKVIENADIFINKRLEEVITNKTILKNWVDDTRVVTWSEPVGGVSCLVKIEGVTNMDDFCRSLADKHSVMLVPGSCFGLDGYARLGFGETPEKFKKGLELLTQHINDLQ